jgi:AraC-like DNA-binding protein
MLDHPRHRDAFSDILSLLNVRGALSVGLRTGGDWAIRFPAPDTIKFNAVMRGSCWLAVDGLKPIRLEPGDCFLLTDNRAFSMGSDLALPLADAREVFAGAGNGVASYNDADELLAIGGRFSLDPANASLLLDVLPPVVHIAGSTAEAAMLRWTLERLAVETLQDLPGAPVMAEHLAHIMFVQVLRAYLAAATPPAPGWLGALSDQRIGQAIRLMHQDPARRWSLDTLASAIGMSRSAFALRFRTLAGKAPMDYLLQWRMRLAKHALRDAGSTVSSVALSLGYASESAFSNAFKRVVGRAPMHYRREP